MKLKNINTNLFNKQSIKGTALALLLALGIPTTAIMNTSCQNPSSNVIQPDNPNPQSDPHQPDDHQQTPDDTQETQYTFKTKNLGGENSGLKMYEWYTLGIMKGKTGDQLIDECLPQYKAYAKGLEQQLEKDLATVQIDKTNEAKGKAMLQRLNDYCGTVKQTLTTNDIDTIVNQIYNESINIYGPLISNYDSANIDKRRRICYPFETLSNEVYGKIGYRTEKMSNEYKRNKNNMIDYMGYFGMSEDEARNDIENNNCQAITTIHFDQMIDAFQNCGLMVDQKFVADLTNLVLSPRSMDNLDGITTTDNNIKKSNHNCQKRLTLDYKMTSALCGERQYPLTENKVKLANLKNMIIATNEQTNDSIIYVK